MNDLTIRARFIAQIASSLAITTLNEAEVEEYGMSPRYRLVPDPLGEHANS